MNLHLQATVIKSLHKVVNEVKDMKKSVIFCVLIFVILFTACSDGRSSEAKLEDELYMKQQVYEEAYNQAIYDVKGELGKWSWCVCVDQEDLVEAIISNSVNYGLTQEEAEDLRDMILSDLDGTNMYNIISNLG